VSVVLKVASLAVCAVLAGCAGGQSTSSGSNAQASALPSAAPSASVGSMPSATDAAAPTAAPTATPGEAVLTSSWTVPFSLTTPAGWRVSGDSTSSTALDIVNEEGLRYVLTFLLKSPDTVDDWVENLTTNQELDATEPQPTEIGGAAGYVVDVALTENARECVEVGATDTCFVLHRDTKHASYILDGRPARIWIVAVGGETVLLWTDAREDRFADWASGMETILQTLEWTTGG
jgi:hypothetical protein